MSWVAWDAWDAWVACVVCVAKAITSAFDSFIGGTQLLIRLFPKTRCLVAVVALVLSCSVLSRSVLGRSVLGWSALGRSGASSW